MTRIEHRLSGVLKTLGLPKNSNCLIALSGGGDSMALLDLIHRVSGIYPLKVSAARVVHGLRSYEDEVAENHLCEIACRMRSVEFRILTAGDGRTPGEDRGRGVEQAARTFRRNLLEKLAEEVGADWILYGHNADDRLETIFMRLLAGSGPEGLAGISWMSGRICRPLLGFSRQELRMHLKQNNIDWAEDRSNDTNAYLRNRFRNELLPLVTEIFPGWSAALDTLGQRSAEAAETLRRASLTELPEVPGAAGAPGWLQSDWDSATEYSKALILWNAFNRLDNSGIPDHRFSWRALKAARNALNSGHDWNDTEMVLKHRDGVIQAGSYPGTGVKWRIILNRDDVNPEFSAVFGGFFIHVTNRETRRVENHRDTGILICWPLILGFDGSGSLPAVDSQGECHDADKELVYISMETA